MKASVDRHLCSGHARCNSFAPEVFDLDDLGYAVLMAGPDGTIAPEHEQDARHGAAACPERAITLTHQRPTGPAVTD